MERRPLILSASRRTDLPGCYPERLAARLDRRLRGLRSYYCYGLVLWTKRPGPLLAHGALRAALARAGSNRVLQLTVTGLGGQALEPGAPRVQELLPLLPRLVAETLGGQAQRLRWRFDPVIPRPGLLDEFRRLADAFAAVGATTCTLSFPAPLSLAGSLGARYREAGVTVPPLAQQAEWIAALHAEAQPRGLRLLACAQPELLRRCAPETLSPAQCVPREVLEGLHPEARPFPSEAKDPAQRQACLCLPSEDLGDYRADPCGCGCLYCYSRAGGPAGRARWQRDATSLPLLQRER